MDIFKDKKVCLVLSCDRPYYRQRREQNYKTYMEFKRLGFVVVFLFAGLTDEAQLSENNDGTFILRVPTLDVYELLSHKMELAYKFFLPLGCTGILKIDDDIKIINLDILIHFLDSNLYRYDYIGISVGWFESNEGDIPAVKKYTLNIFKKFRHSKAKVTYAGGPFYWVSFKAIEHIAKDGLEFIFEDVSVGYVIQNHVELTKLFTQSISNIAVVWNNESEN